MKKITLILVIVAIAALALTSIAMAQGTNPPTDTPYGGGRFGGGQVGDGYLHEYMIAYLADAFGMTVDELDSRLAGGERMMDIAYGLEYTVEEAYQLMNEARAYALDEALADGTITQEQYDFMQARAQNGRGMGMGRYGGTDGSFGQGRGGGRHGNMGGQGFNQDCPNYIEPAPSN
jgi:hypothetical protein